MTCKNNSAKRISFDNGKTFMTAQEAIDLLAKKDDSCLEWESILECIEDELSGGWQGPCSMAPPKPKKGYHECFSCEEETETLKLYLEKYAETDLVLDFSDMEEE